MGVKSRWQYHNITKPFSSVFQTLKTIIKINFFHFQCFCHKCYYVPWRQPSCLSLKNISCPSKNALRVCACLLSHFSCVRVFATPWTAAYPSLLSMGFSRQEYWSGLSMPSSGDSSKPRDQTLVSYVSCTGRWAFYH